MLSLINVSYVTCSLLDFRQPNIDATTNSNDTTQAILSAIPVVLHKYLLKPKNNLQGRKSVNF